jgi:hypothetical protein
MRSAEFGLCVPSRCYACIRRREDCSGPRINFGKRKPPVDVASGPYAPLRQEHDFNFDLVPLDLVCQSPARSEGSNPGDTSSMSISVLPPGGQFGNAYFGCLRAEPAILDLFQFWQTKSLQTRDCDAESSLPKRARELGLMAFSHDIQSHAMVATLAAYHSRITSSAQSRALQVQSYGQTLARLREVMVNIKVPVQLLSTANMLVGAELSSGNYAAVSHHMKFLIDLLAPERGGVLPQVIRLRHSVMVLEFARAAITQTRPLMDISAWTLHDRLRGPWSESLECDPPGEALDEQALGDDYLIELFRQMRYYDAILRDTELCENVNQSQAYQMSWRILDLGTQLLNYAIDVRLTARARLDRCQRAAAALAALFLFRLRTRTEPAGHLNTKTQQTPYEKCWAAGPMLLSHITELLDHTDAVAWDLVHLGAGPALRLRLWILHVGSIIEVTADFDGRRPSYCSRGLDELVVALNISQDMLQRYLESIFVLHSVDGEVSGPRWLTPELRTFGYPNWNGEIAGLQQAVV